MGYGQGSSCKWRRLRVRNCKLTSDNLLFHRVMIGTFHRQAENSLPQHGYGQPTCTNIEPFRASAAARHMGIAEISNGTEDIHTLARRESGRN